jgi:hypothetical protein
MEEESILGLMATYTLEITLKAKNMVKECMYLLMDGDMMVSGSMGGYTER